MRGTVLYSASRKVRGTPGLLDSWIAGLLDGCARYHSHGLYARTRHCPTYSVNGGLYPPVQQLLGVSETGSPVLPSGTSQSRQLTSAGLDCHEGSLCEGKPSPLYASRGCSTPTQLPCWVVNCYYRRLRRGPGYLIPRARGVPQPCPTFIPCQSVDRLLYVGFDRPVRAGSGNLGASGREVLAVRLS